MKVLMNVYYPGRIDNVRKNIKSVLAHDVVDGVVVFNNNSQQISLPDYGEKVTLINSNRNFGYRASFITPLLSYASKYFLMDDDVTIEKRTLENFDKYLSEGLVVGYSGRILGDSDKPYTRPKMLVKAKEMLESVRVDVLVGRGGLGFTWKSVLNMLNKEYEFLSQYDESREMDLLLSYSNKSYVIPCGDGEDLVGLSEHGVGYHRGEGHYGIRDKVIRLMRGEE